MAKRVLKDWSWFMRDIRVSPDNLVLKGPRIEGFEADILKISPLGYTIEYEIKISRNDYMVDTYKSLWVTDGRGRRQDFDTPIRRVFKHDLLNAGNGANKFYYVVPDELVRLDEVPPYAGLIYTHDQNFWVVKPAPTIGYIRRPSMYERYKKSLND